MSMILFHYDGGLVGRAGVKNSVCVGSKVMCNEERRVCNRCSGVELAWALGLAPRRIQGSSGRLGAASETPVVTEHDHGIVVSLSGTGAKQPGEWVRLVLSQITQPEEHRTARHLA